MVIIGEKKIVDRSFSWWAALFQLMAGITTIIDFCIELGIYEKKMIFLPYHVLNQSPFKADNDVF